MRALLEPGVHHDAPSTAPMPFVQTLVRGALLVAADGAPVAARIVEAALGLAPPGNAGWLVPIEPLLDVSRAGGVWQLVLLALRARAA